MSKSLIVYASGMGDHLICNGLIREHSKTDKQVCLYSNAMYHHSVEFMYRDLPNVSVHTVDIRRQAYTRFIFDLAHRVTGVKIYLLQAEEEDGIVWEHFYYAIAQVPMRKKWESFNIIRDTSSEKLLFDHICPRGRYIFVHEDDRFRINPNLIPEDLQVVRASPSLTENFFDWCSVIEHAEEVHVISSSFMYLVDLLQYTNPKQKLVLHMYARPTLPNRYPLLKKQWLILK